VTECCVTHVSDNRRWVISTLFFHWLVIMACHLTPRNGPGYHVVPVCGKTECCYHLYHA